MRSVFKFMLVAFVASLAFVSCDKKDQPQKEKEKEKEEQKEEEGNKEQEGTQEPEQEEVKLAIDGKFGEWADIEAVEGDGAILLTKAQADAKKLYFYLEADLAEMVNEKHDFANKLYLCLDCGGGANSIGYWGGEEGCSYDAMYEIWLMTNGGTTMANWDTGFAGKAKIEDGVYKAEIAYPRSANEAFEAKTIWYGIYVTDTICDGSYPDEVYGGGDLIGLAPAEGEDMAKMK